MFEFRRGMEQLLRWRPLSKGLYQHLYQKILIILQEIKKNKYTYKLEKKCKKCKYCFNHFEIFLTLETVTQQENSPIFLFRMVG